MMARSPERYRIVEERYRTAPQLPPDRPPTKKEVWDFWDHVYGDVKTRDKLIAEAKQDWAFKYVVWWLHREWRKQPDWVEGDPVILDAVPHYIDTDNWQRIVNECWQRAQEAKR